MPRAGAHELAGGWLQGDPFGPSSPRESEGPEQNSAQLGGSPGVGKPDCHPRAPVPPAAQLWGRGSAVLRPGPAQQAPQPGTHTGMPAHLSQGSSTKEHTSPILPFAHSDVSKPFGKAAFTAMLNS